VPLHAPDADITFDLAEVFTSTYDRGRFARKVDNSIAAPGLSTEDRAWAATIVKPPQ
jgi:hypothetical protein